MIITFFLTVVLALALALLHDSRQTQVNFRQIELCYVFYLLMRYREEQECFGFLDTHPWSFSKSKLKVILVFRAIIRDFLGLAVMSHWFDLKPLNKNDFSNLKTKNDFTELLKIVLINIFDQSKNFALCIKNKHAYHVILN